MDYHLDWIHAALEISTLDDDFGKVGPIDIKDKEGELIFEANQQDTDLLVAFERSDIVHLVLIEAKATSGWNNEQLEQKAERLEAIFGNGENGGKYPFVKPHFVLTSPKRSNKIKFDKWPKWMLDDENDFNFMRLQLPKLMSATRKKIDSKKLYFQWNEYKG